MKEFYRALQEFEIRATGGFAIFICLIVFQFFALAFLEIIKTLLKR